MNTRSFEPILPSYEQVMYIAISLNLTYVKVETNKEEEKQDCHQLLDKANLSMDFIHRVSLNRTLPISLEALDQFDEERIIQTR